MGDYFYCVVEVVTDDNTKNEFDVHLKGNRNIVAKLATKLAKLMADDRLTPPDDLQQQLMTNSEIYCHKSQSFVKFNQSVHQFNESRIRIRISSSAEDWIQTLERIARQSNTPYVVKTYLPILKKISFDVMPKTHKDFVRYVVTDKGLGGKCPKSATVNILWEVVDKAIEKYKDCANTSIDDNSDQSTSTVYITPDESLSGGNGSALEANEEPVGSTSTSTANSSRIVISKRKAVPKEEVDVDSGDDIELVEEVLSSRKQMARKRQKKADDDYYLIEALNRCLRQRSVDVWKRVTHLMVTNKEQDFSQMSESKAQIQWLRLLAKYLRVLESAKSKIEATDTFKGFDLLNTTDLSSLLTPSDNQLVSQLKAKLYPTVDTDLVKKEEDEEISIIE